MPRLMLSNLTQLDGKIIAPTSSGAWGSGLLQWIEFTKLKGITIRGKGTIDGQGSVWWNDSPTFDPKAEDGTVTGRLLLWLTTSLHKALPSHFHLRMQIMSVWQISTELGGKMPGTKPTVITFFTTLHFYKLTTDFEIRTSDWWCYLECRL